tara:strand:- start:1246 stop:2052 length:807 start_codon:yes stop_codon:yes gene_type:complete
MLKIIKKIQFSKEKNRMKTISDTKYARKIYKSTKNKNVKYLLHNRFGWMNSYIKENDIGIEVGSGSGFAKDFIKNKNFKLTDLSNDEHLDFKNIDAQDTKFEKESFDYVIASNMIHHIPYPIKFFKEMHRILKKNGKLLIFEAYSSIALQLITICMRHEGFDFTVNVWDEKKPKSDEKDVWSGNIAVSNLIFDDKSLFQKNLGKYFKMEHQELSEFLIFLNSGGVTSKTLCIPMNEFFMKILDFVDKILIKIFPQIFCLGRKIVLIKN